MSLMCQIEDLSIVSSYQKLLWFAKELECS